MAVRKNPLRARFTDEFFNSLPREPGVYFMRDGDGELLYVGKAKSLRARVKTYRNAGPGKVGPNIVQMLKRVRTIEWEILESEKRAAERERELIRAFVPPFNIADAWKERYFFIGLRVSGDGAKLEFRLTSRKRESTSFQLHGCYAHRRRVKEGYRALLRLLFAATFEGKQFAFPARLAEEWPAWRWALRMRDAEGWLARVSSFLSGDFQAGFLEFLVEALLENDQLPVYVRPGLQRDLQAVIAFRDACLAPRIERPAEGFLTHEELRRRIRASVRPKAANESLVE